MRQLSGTSQGLIGDVLLGGAVLLMAGSEQTYPRMAAAMSESELAFGPGIFVHRADAHHVENWLGPVDRGDLAVDTPVGLKECSANPLRATPRTT